MSYQFTNDHREYIKRELAARVRRRPLYSQRAFARDMGLAPSSLTDFLKGRIGFSSGRISQISKQLGLSTEQKSHWNDLIEGKFSRDIEKRKLSLVRVRARLESEKSAFSMEEFKSISEWQHCAYLELIDLNPKKYSDVKIAANDLQIPLKLMKETQQRLLQLNLIKLTEDGLYQVEPNRNLGNRIPSESIRHFHQQILEKATVALETQSMQRRFNSSTIVGLPKSKIGPIIEELNSMAFKILEPHLDAVNGEVNEELYCLSLQFFDLLKQAEVKK
ncbi:MAG: TIGR02147 family protein [Bdellovibrio sp.]|nr:TIGR02147 family protein [Bdellovibrio sp.]